jgi:hypothetical protein
LYSLGAKQPKKYSSEAFSDAMTKILASTLTGSDKRVKAPAKKIDLSVLYC